MSQSGVEVESKVESKGTGLLPLVWAQSESAGLDSSNIWNKLLAVSVILTTNINHVFPYLRFKLKLLKGTVRPKVENAVLIYTKESGGSFVVH